MKGLMVECNEDEEGIKRQGKTQRVKTGQASSILSALKKQDKTIAWWFFCYTHTHIHTRTQTHAHALTHKKAQNYLSCYIDTICHIPKKLPTSVHWDINFSITAHLSEGKSYELIKISHKFIDSGLESTM